MITREQKRLRILHIVYPLIRGGIETWMLHVLRESEGTGYEMHFATHRLGCPLDEEYRRLGAKLHLISPANQPIAHARSLRRLIKREGPFDIIHTHVHHSGLELLILRRCGVPVRIAHAHNTAGAWKHAPLPERLVVSVTLPFIRKYATHGFACSIPAAQDFFGKNWLADGRFNILHYGIPLNISFKQHEPSMDIRCQLGLAPDVKLVAVVGRFAHQKNHAFAIKVADVATRQMRHVHFVFFGDGPLRSKLARMIQEKGLEDRVHLLGSVPNIPYLMRTQLDLLLLPSLWEGLPMVIIESQAAGLPAVTSYAVPEEAVVIPELVSRLSLDLPPSQWADCIRQKLSQGRSIQPQKAIAIVEKTDFDIRSSVSKLLTLYDAACCRRFR